MRLHLQTAVAQHYQTVIEGFDIDLFKALSPLFPKVKILRFDGSFPGDRVEVELAIGPICQRWTSLITERNITEQAAWFTDEGQELPPPLRFWRHQHLITRQGNHSIIHDLIEYRTTSKWLDVLVYPVLYAQFNRRSPVYKRIFGQVT